MHSSSWLDMRPSRTVTIAWEYEGGLILRAFQVDFELLAEEYDGDIVAYVQEVHAPPFEWRFK